MKYQIFFAPIFILLTANCLFAQVTLSGEITVPDGYPLGDLNMTVTNSLGDIVGTYYIDCDGIYEIPGLTEGEQYSLEIVKDSSPLNGISTFDMVLIAKYILGTYTTDPYTTFAMDVNDSGNVTVLDLAILRAIILAIMTEFPNSARDWFFFEEGVHQSPASFDIQLNENAVQNYIGVKRGDTNGTAANCN